MTCETEEESSFAKLWQFSVNRRKVEIIIVILDNHLKPSGNYVHHMVYHYETVFCLHSVYALRMIPAIDTDCSPTYISFTDRVFAIVTNYIHCEVRSEVLYVHTFWAKVSPQKVWQINSTRFFWEGSLINVAIRFLVIKDISGARGGAIGWGNAL
jgi:hypothetical protein